MSAHCVEYWSKDFVKDDVYHNQTLSKMSDGRYILAESTKRVGKDIFWSFIKPEEYTDFVELDWMRHKIWQDATQEWIDAPLTS